jgi:hypothetical protein
MKKFLFGMATALALAIVLPGSLHAAGGRIALLNSDIYAYNFFALHYVNCGAGNVRIGANEYQRYFLGWKYVLQGQPDNAKISLPTQSPYSFDVINDSMITDGSLAAYDLLILSNTVSLSDDQESAIQAWVQKGGKLIATFGSGYKDITTDPKQDDGLKLNKGGTTGLHNLWHDPMTKAFGTQALTPPPGVRIVITDATGPTNIPGWQGTILSYGAEANLLTSRPEDFKDLRAILLLDPPDAARRAPVGILDTRFSKGKVVYFSFAPEFITALAFDLTGHCPGDTSYPAGSPANTPGPDAADFPNGFVGPAAVRVGPMMQLMQNTIDYMLAN